ncbi:MAG: peptidase U32 [Planctomycetes bacterium GWF2_50_10]|nr:MAG: peptidase U32 [Planctomycetes bacterium GWF2_50_10]
MRLSVAANYDQSITSELAKYPVEEVFGKLPGDFAGGGRPAYISTPITKAGLETYIKTLHQNGIKFNYLLNSSCMANREWTRAWQKDLMRMLDWLTEIGVNRLTVSTPYLLETIKARRSNFYVRVGIFAQVDTPARARFWENLGADAITLESFSINRDFELLEQIRRAVKCDLQLIANHICLWNCPMQCYHQNGIAHSSHSSGGLFIDYCLFNCALARISDETQLIKSRWIRPEDTSRYEKVGYTNFKILERGMPSTQLLKRVEAYSIGRYDGNLAQLLCYYGFKEETHKPRLWAMRNFFKPWHIKTKHLGCFLKTARLQGMGFKQQNQPIFIDSAKIPADFLDIFQKRSCIGLDCSKCGHCAAIARDAVRIEPAFRSQSIEQLSKINQMLVEGDLWI